ncbi:M14 family metallopeptidase [Lysobacter sp. ISL-42]|nr:M14 family metallopeptidase [Lysobacter sp. ISL-42]MBT2753080.1 M14 family metallopeptidase [Lysobacter sp. ISL-50]MBT2777249.1 M14 family metallopeptidase [Lysobacter sp. ISL-54]MBT2783229.1 M14 family metallopeptidase [Lysobacter sp. ISL-52]
MTDRLFHSPLLSRGLLPLALSFALAAPAMAAPEPLTTVSERSGFVKTGRYQEVIELCAQFAQRYPDAVRCEDFGTTPEGRPMKVLVATRSGAFTPQQAQAKNLPVLLIQGGIHSGEIDGKDAGFLALRQALDGEAAKGALDKQVLLFVPVFNIDGHERFGRWNRPNQRGPEEMGWRTTAQNYNLNRDYLKADAPEMQAMLKLFERWDPLAYVDLHVTDGAKFEHDVSIQVEPVHAGDEALRKAGTALRDGVIERLNRNGSMALWYYPSFVESDNPASGFEDSVPPPRFSHGYFFLRNRLGMLVETHSWKDYPTRVRITRNTIVDVLDLVAANGADWRRTALAADQRAQALGGQNVAIDYKAGDKIRTVAFRGYAYTRTPSDVSGALMTRYDETKPEIWNIPLKYDIQPSRQVLAPRGGYLVPAAHAAWVAAKLDQHGVSYRRLDSALKQARVETFRADKAEFAAQSVEGHQRTTLSGDWKAETQDLVAGALFVPIAQPKARLAIALLEPLAPDSLAAWGEFNNAFERKEYMEDYVAEDVAREMLKDPKVKAEFDARLQSDAAFAKSPQARLDFFYRRHSAWDTRYNQYPVLRTQSVPR